MSTTINWPFVAHCVKVNGSLVLGEHCLVIEQHPAGAWSYLDARLDEATAHGLRIITVMVSAVDKTAPFGPVLLDVAVHSGGAS